MQKLFVKQKEILGGIENDVTSKKLFFYEFEKFFSNLYNKLFKHEKEPERYKIVFSLPAYLTIKELVDVSEIEIAWFGIIRREGQTIYIDEIINFPQIRTSVSVEVDDEEFASWFSNMVMTDKQKALSMRYHGHSHVNMGVFPSQTDMNYRKELSHNLDKEYIFSIHNKRGEIRFHIYDAVTETLAEPEDVDIFVEDIPLADIKEKIIGWGFEEEASLPFIEGGNNDDI
jgi:hypothetical protein